MGVSQNCRAHTHCFHIPGAITPTLECLYWLWYLVLLGLRSVPHCQRDPVT